MGMVLWLVGSAQSIPLAQHKPRELQIWLLGQQFVGSGWKAGIWGRQNCFAAVCLCFNSSLISYSASVCSLCRVVCSSDSAFILHAFEQRLHSQLATSPNLCPRQGHIFQARNESLGVSRPEKRSVGTNQKNS